MQVKSTVKIDSSMLQAICDEAVRALEQTAEAVHAEVVQAQVVPRRDGALQGESFFVDDSESAAGRVMLVHNEPYARRLYYHPEYQFHTGPWEEKVRHRDGSVSHRRHDGNPNARGEWFEDWLPGGKHENFAAETFEKFFKKQGGS